MGTFVRLELHGAVGVIRLDRPPVNAINSQVHTELLAVAGEAAERTALAGFVQEALSFRDCSGPP